ncbi:MAG TPA: hypothetical protein VK196_13695 [Magnetospirillum sp.]|nr:hypothetical protein [Magnetospirillum sp.]
MTVQEAVAALVVAAAAAILGLKLWRAIRRRCRPRGKDDCGKCCKCG